jgi:hypothetical protein
MMRKEENMNINEIKSMAKKNGVKTGKMQKAEIIRAIQRAENNFDCYGTDRVQNCNEQKCLWLADCAKERQ